MSMQVVKLNVLVRRDTLSFSSCSKNVDSGKNERWLTVSLVNLLSPLAEQVAAMNLRLLEEARAAESSRTELNVVQLTGQDAQVRHFRSCRASTFH
jgi:hypothetical protein